MPDSNRVYSKKCVKIKEVNSLRQTGCNCGNKYYMPVTWNDMLELVALYKCVYSENKDWYSHYEEEGSTCEKRLIENGYLWSISGENLLDGAETEKKAMDCWIALPTHCRVIINKGFAKIGVARKANFWTMALAKRIEYWQKKIEFHSMALY